MLLIGLNEMEYEAYMDYPKLGRFLPDAAC
jgi:hypothetical protein